MIQNGELKIAKKDNNPRNDKKSYNDINNGYNNNNKA